MRCILAGIFLNGLVSLSPAASDLSLKPTQPLAAFTLDHPPGIEITLAPGRAQHGLIRIERFDLLSEETAVEYLSITTGKYTPHVPYGIYRIDAALVDDRTQVPAAGTGARLFFAYTPAQDPRHLPDDWPLGMHVTFEDGPLPGFKWYRYFSSWTDNNPAKGTYDWKRLDSVFARVKEVGGHLFIANDTAPIWTAPEHPATRAWSMNSLSYPPDDMNDFRAYTDALLTRYDDKDGTLGALEVWNEANTPERWLGTPGQLTDFAKILHESALASQARVHRPAPVKIVGIAVSSGHQKDYVEAVIKAGTLSWVDVVSGHWYEEMLSYDAATPINSLPLHVDLLAKPMHAAGFSLPIWNTESGIGCVARENGKLVPQNELNRRAAALPGFNAKQPWMVDAVKWRDVSERRAAASYVAGTAMLMGLGVEKTFVYSMRDMNWILDGAPSLSWVALGVFGDQIRGVDFRSVAAVPAKSESSDASVRSLAYRFGAPDKPGVIVAWGYLQDLTVGRPKLWQPWLDPQPVRLEINASEVEVTDLYGREKKRMAVTDGSVVLPVGEEPVYLRELPAGATTASGPR